MVHHPPTDENILVLIQELDQVSVGFPLVMDQVFLLTLIGRFCLLMIPDNLSASGPWGEDGRIVIEAGGSSTKPLSPADTFCRSLADPRGGVLVNRTNERHFNGMASWSI